MSDSTLHGVLRMSPDLWQETEVDKMQRHSRYLEASEKILEMEKVISELCKSLEPVYSGSPEGRAYLSKCRKLLD